MEAEQVCLSHFKVVVAIPQHPDFQSGAQVPQHLHHHLHPSIKVHAWTDTVDLSQIVTGLNIEQCVGV